MRYMQSSYAHIHVSFQHIITYKMTACSEYPVKYRPHYYSALSFITPFVHMAPKRSVIVPPAQATRQSSRGARKPSTDVIVDAPKRKESQASKSRQRRDEENEVVVKKAPQQLSEDLYDGPPGQPVHVLEEEDADKHTGDAGSQSQMKVCANKAPHFIYVIIMFRTPWTNGRNSAADISTCCWKCRDWWEPQLAPCALAGWRSSVMTVMVPTTSASPAAWRHTGVHHTTGYSDGLVNTLHQCLFMNSDLSYTLDIRENHVP
jgi:hypothetical protein